jgi:TetR/AcrR family transcriptional repressor of nem operon
MTHYFQDKRHLVKDVIAWQAEFTLHQHRAPELGELDSFAALRLWADLHIERQQAFGAFDGEEIDLDAS